MSFDAHKNFAVSTVATAPSPASSGTSLVVASGHGTRFPTVPFNATVWPSSGSADPSNAEVVRVTAISTDTLTIARAQEGSSARTVVVGDRIAATITAKTFTDIEGILSTTQEYTLGGSVTMTNADQFYDGPSGSFAAGTWLVNWRVIIVRPSALTQAYTAKLWDGTNVYDECEVETGAGSASDNTILTGFAVVTLGSTTTLKVSAISARAGTVIQRDVAYNSSSTHRASAITALKIG